MFHVGVAVEGLRSVVGGAHVCAARLSRVTSTPRTTARLGLA